MALACIGSLEHLRYVPQENGQLVAGWGCSEGYEWIGQEPGDEFRIGQWVGKPGKAFPFIWSVPK